MPSTPAPPRVDCPAPRWLPSAATGAPPSAGGRGVFKITPSFLALTMDLRLVLVAAPIVLAASWAVFHIGRAAVGQLQMMIARARA